MINTYFFCSTGLCITQDTTVWFKQIFLKNNNNLDLLHYFSFLQMFDICTSSFFLLATKNMIKPHCCLYSSTLNLLLLALSRRRPRHRRPSTHSQKQLGLIINVRCHHELNFRHLCEGHLYLRQYLASYGQCYRMGDCQRMCWNTG